MDELRSALELATEDELEQLTQILFCRRFNPLDYLQNPDPIAIQSQNRDRWLSSLEERFRFLAADGLTVLRRQTHRISYRQALIQICRYLKIAYSDRFTTPELESEIYLHLLQQAWKKLPDCEQQALLSKVQQSLRESGAREPLPATLDHQSLNLFLKGGSALAVSSVLRPLLLRHLTRQFALHLAEYQVARHTLVRGGAAATTAIQTQVTLQTAQQGMVLATTRYTAVRTVFAFLGPALWAWFFADLGWRTIATNYGRIIPAVFALAQIRLLRAEAWDPVYAS